MLSKARKRVGGRDASYSVTSGLWNAQTNGVGGEMQQLHARAVLAWHDFLKLRILYYACLEFVVFEAVYDLMEKQDVKTLKMYHR